MPGQLSLAEKLFTACSGLIDVMRCRYDASNSVIRQPPAGWSGAPGVPSRLRNTHQARALGQVRLAGPQWTRTTSWIDVQAERSDPCA